jgi:hypothetical protein
MTFALSARALSTRLLRLRGRRGARAPAVPPRPPARDPPDVATEVGGAGEEAAHPVPPIEAPETEMVEMWNADAPSGPEYGGPRGAEPTRYGDWAQKGRCTDF